MLLEQDIGDQVLVGLRRIMRAVDLHSRKLMQKYDMTVPQLIVLREITRHGEVSIGELTKRVSLSNATVTGIVDRLEQRGWVQRSRGQEDRRQVLVRAAEEAPTILKNTPPLLQERFLAELESLQKSEQGEILSALEKIASMMNAENLEASPVLSNLPLLASEDSIEDSTTGSSDGKKKKGKKEKRDESSESPREESSTGPLLRIHEIRRFEEFPPWIDRKALALFLHENLKPYEDTLPDIERGLDDALSPRQGENGFVLIADIENQAVGALVMLRTGMKGYVPENLLLFVAVNGLKRGHGIGSRLVKRAIELSEGNIKLHVDYGNPARRLYERLGFHNKYAEMRFYK
ncbi:MAG: GNAT family N-acetyltransferase [bacterium]